MYLGLSPLAARILISPRVMALSGSTEETDKTRTIVTSLLKGRSVHLVKLPKIESQQAYASLFALSQNPIGVTGNQSLSMAIALVKIPLYDVNRSQQRDINAHLASYDETGLLAPVFSNSINPQEKAAVISQHGDIAKPWAANIFRHKTASDLIETYIRLSLQPDPEIERLLLEINTLFNAGINASDDIIVHDALLIKQFFAKLNTTIGLAQSLNEADLWQEALSIYHQLIDPDIRRWFYNMAIR